MQSNAALHGIVELVLREPAGIWSLFGGPAGRWTRPFRWDLPGEGGAIPWDDLDPWPEDTLEQAWEDYQVEPRWVEDRLGIPRESQRGLSTELLDAYRELMALQEEHGEELEFALLREDPGGLAGWPEGCRFVRG